MLPCWWGHMRAAKSNLQELLTWQTQRQCDNQAHVLCQVLKEPTSSELRWTLQLQTSQVLIPWHTHFLKTIHQVHPSTSFPRFPKCQHSPSKVAQSFDPVVLYLCSLKNLGMVSNLSKASDPQVNLPLLSSIQADDYYPACWPPTRPWALKLHQNHLITQLPCRFCRLLDHGRDMSPCPQRNFEVLKKQRLFICFL